MQSLPQVVLQLKGIQIDPRGNAKVKIQVEPMKSQVDVKVYVFIITKTQNEVQVQVFMYCSFVKTVKTKIAAICKFLYI